MPGGEERSWVVSRPAATTAAGRGRAGISGWAWILIAGLFEVGFVFALKMEQQDSRYLPMFIVCAVISFECLAEGIKTVPLSIGYAVWTGIGAVGSFILGILVFDDPTNLLRMLLVAGLILALITLKVVSRSKQ